MNKILNKVKLFYKLAAGFTDDPDILPEERERLKKMYEDELKLLPSSSLKDICKFINMWHREPFFDNDTVLNILMQVGFSGFGGSSANPLNSIFYYLLQEKLPSTTNWDKFMARYYIDHFLDKMFIGDFLILEKFKYPSEYLPVEYLRKIQNHIIKHIIELYKNNEENVAISWMRQLYRESKFPHKFLENLAKHLSPEFYAKFTQNENTSKESRWAHENSLNEIYNQDKYNIYDAARLMNDTNEYTPDFIKTLLERGDQKVKDFVRSFLYENNWEKSPSSRFIIDDEFNPINDQLKVIKWPASFSIVVWDKLSDKEKIKWGEIFSDFKMIHREKL